MKTSSIALLALWASICAAAPNYGNAEETYGGHGQGLDLSSDNSGRFGKGWNKDHGNYGHGHADNLPPHNGAPSITTPSVVVPTPNAISTPAVPAVSTPCASTPAVSTPAAPSVSAPSVEIPTGVPRAGDAVSTPCTSSLAVSTPAIPSPSFPASRIPSAPSCVPSQAISNPGLEPKSGKFGAWDILKPHGLVAEALTILTGQAKPYSAGDRAFCLRIPDNAKPETDIAVSQLTNICPGVPYVLQAFYRMPLVISGHCEATLSVDGVAVSTWKPSESIQWNKCSYTLEPQTVARAVKIDISFKCSGSVAYGEKKELLLDGVTLTPAL